MASARGLVFDVRFDAVVDVKGLTEMASPETLRRARTVLAMRVGLDSNRYCKVDTWLLQSTMQVTSDFENGEVRWSARKGGRDYARYAYYQDGLGPQSVANNRTSKWFETAKSRHVDSWRRYVKNEILKG